MFLESVGTSCVNELVLDQAFVVQNSVSLHLVEEDVLLLISPWLASRLTSRSSSRNCFYSIRIFFLWEGILSTWDTQAPCLRRALTLLLGVIRKTGIDDSFIKAEYSTVPQLLLIAQRPMIRPDLNKILRIVFHILETPPYIETTCHILLKNVLYHTFILIEFLNFKKPSDD